MQQHGGSQYPPATGSPFGKSQPPAPQAQATQTQSPGLMGRRRPMNEEQSPASPKGITMGAGYANRPFG
jgi:hypothetical protein